MFRLFSAIGAFCFFTQHVFAACAGTDIRETLSQNDLAEISQKVSSTPFAEGNHWRAQRGAQSIHLIGTIHIDDPKLATVTQRLAGVIESSDIALFEMTNREEEELKSAMTTRPELLFLQETSLPEEMPEDDWQKLMSALRERGVPPTIASRFQPWYLSLILTMPPCLTASLVDGANGLDHQLMAIAEKQEIPAQALEPYDTLFSIFQATPLDEQIDQLMLSIEGETRNEDLLATLRIAYFNEKHAEIWELSRWNALQIKGMPREDIEATFAKMEAGLLIDRNRAWMPVILDKLEGNTQITVAVGAAHLGGSSGLLALLEAEGFALERLPF